MYVCMYIWKPIIFLFNQVFGLVIKNIAVWYSLIKLYNNPSDVSDLNFIWNCVFTLWSYEIILVFYFCESEGVKNKFS